MKNFKARVRLATLIFATVVVDFALPGCVTPDSTECADGLICPPGSRCDDVNHRCISATEEAACAGLHEGDACTLLGAKGTCRTGICQPHFCGDGMVSELEQCDGAPVPGDQTCSRTNSWQPGTLAGSVSGSSSQGDRGFARCTESCQVSFDRCETMGWQPVWLGDGENGNPATTPYQAIWGSSADDVWAAGESFVVHWDGNTWSWTPSPPDTVAEVRWSGVWGAGPNDVWAVAGYHPPPFIASRDTIFDHGVFHWNGNAWEPSITLDTGSSTPKFPPRLWGTGARDVYVFGQSLLKHWDGSQWSDVRPSQSASLVFSSMTGSGPDDVFALDQQTVWHWDGNTWGTVNIGDDQIGALWAPSAQVGYALGAKALYKRDGASWTPIPGAAGGLPLVGGGGQVWGTGPNNVFVVRRKADDGTDSSTVSHWNGDDWSTIYDGPASGVWGDGRDTVFLAGSEGILQPNVATWRPLSIEAEAMWGVGEDLFVLGSPLQPGAVAYATDGSTSFTLLPPLPLPVPTYEHAGGLRGPFGSIWASAANDIWVSVGDFPESNVWHWDGMSWSLGTKIMSGSVALGGSGPSDIWAVGQFTTHWDGHTWSEPEHTAVAYNAVWAASSEDAYEVGASGSIRHWDGKAWTEMTSGTTANLYDVWGSGPDDVYAVGGGATLHLDAGKQWSPLASAPTNLVQVKGSSSGNVFASDRFALYHLRAGAWETISTPAYKATESLWVTPRSVYVSPWSGTARLSTPPGTEMKGFMNVHRLDLVGVTCQSPETNCTDGWDNDCDGLQDGADPDCAGKAATEICGNLADDDYDGLADCDDPDCAAFLNCHGPMSRVASPSAPPHE